MKPWNNEKVRQAIAMGINRQQIVDNFYPRRLRGRDPLHAVRRAVRLRGRRTWDFDAAAGQGAPDRGTAYDGISFKTTKLSFRAAVRGYLPDPPADRDRDRERS